MSDRRFQLVEISDDDGYVLPYLRGENPVKRRKVHFADDDYEDNGTKDVTLSGRKKENEKKNNGEEPVSKNDASERENDEWEDLARPVGEVIKVSIKGKQNVNHYNSFEYDGLRYHIEDPVLLVPEHNNKKPWVVILKDIFQTRQGDLMVTAQRFYRPEEAEKIGGGYWHPSCMREVFYSVQRADMPAEYVMHKCALHYIPLDKPIPPRKQLPGFIFHRVYNAKMMKLFKFSDKHDHIYSKFLVKE